MDPMSASVLGATLLPNIIAAIVFAVIGILIFLTAFFVIDRMTPFMLWKEIIEEHNTALAVLIGFMALGISIIIAAAIH